MTDDANIGVGVLGATGYIGQPYRDEMRQVSGVRLVALCARRHELLQAAGAADDADLLTDDWRAVIDHPAVNFVVVATPDALHHEATLACAAAGKHILCEKPVGKTADEASQMYRAYRDAAGLAHFVPFWTRYVDIFRRTKEIVDSGKLGTIRGIVYRWHNPRPANMPLTWRDDANLSAGGSIADVGSHAYDTVCWLLGSEAKRVLVHADTITSAKPDLGAINLDEAIKFGNRSTSDVDRRLATTPDYANISWVFSDGAVGTLMVSHASSFRKGVCPELELHGTDASLAINRVTGTVTLATPDGQLNEVANIADQGFGNRFEKYVFPVVRAAMSEIPPPEHPNLHDGWRVQCFTDAAIKSATAGTWVEVPG